VVIPELFFALLYYLGVIAFQLSFSSLYCYWYLHSIISQDNDKLYIFLELVTKGSLAVLYKKYCLTNSQVSAYTRQILSGLKYLHDRNVIHR